MVALKQNKCAPTATTMAKKQERRGGIETFIRGAGAAASAPGPQKQERRGGIETRS